MKLKSCISFNLRWCFALVKGFNLADFCLSVVGGASIEHIHITGRPPCFVSESALPVVENILDYYLDGINNAIYVLKFQTESLLQRMGITYCINVTTNEMEHVGFMDLSLLDADADKRTFLQDFCFNTPSFLNQMRAHYGILNELTNYFEELRKTSVNDNPQEFQENIYDIMCRIKMALRSQNQDPLSMVPNDLCLSVMVGASSQRRDVNANPPCFLHDSGLPVTINTLYYYLEGINNAINVLKFQTESLLQSMANTCINLSSNGMENVGFMDLSSHNADTDKQIFLQDFCYNTPSFVNQMRAHYDILNELTNYLEELRMTSINDNPRQFQKHVYVVMCQVKMALRSQNQDPEVTVPSGELSEIFILYRRNPVTVCKQKTSEYISLLDCKRIVTYLETVYRPFNTTGLNCI